jgi:hypothetical protein
MKYKKITLQINKPVAEIFAFLLNPKNTPLWIDTILYEETNEWPVKLGTIFKNKNNQNIWSSYEVTKFVENTLFEFSMQNSPYHVRYVFSPTKDNYTNLEYFEWVDYGEIPEPFSKKLLKKLKKLLENDNIKQ